MLSIERRRARRRKKKLLLSRVVKNPTKLAKRRAKKLNRDGKRMERTIECSMRKEAVGHAVAVDGIDLEDGDKLPFTNDPDPKKNGIYKVTLGRWDRL